MSGTSMTIHSIVWAFVECGSSFSIMVPSFFVVLKVLKKHFEDSL